MALAPKDLILTATEYLEQEKSSDTRHEYDNGYIVAMVGASRAHNIIAVTLATAIQQHIKGKPCQTYVSDMKLHIKKNGNDLFYYPDIMVSCDPNPVSEYYEEKPILVIEILSPNTETRDKLEKLSAYSSVESLMEYLTIAQDKAEIYKYTFTQGKTLLTEYHDGDLVEFNSIGLSIFLKDIYANIAGKIPGDL